MMRSGLARAALRCYPPVTRRARGAEMLDTLLEASSDRPAVFVWNVVSLLAAGLGERARASARVSVGRTIAEAAKLASILYACLWLTADLAVLIERRGWHHAVLLYMVGLLIILLAWSQGRQRLAGVIGLGMIAFASTQPAPWKLLVATAPAVLAATAARARVIRRKAI